MTAIPSRTVRFHEHGEALDVLLEERTEIPDPPASAVRIRVAATALNPADLEICRGFAAGSLPRGIGCDAAGVVDALGDGVTDLRIGDAVFGIVDFAGQASAGAADVAILRTWFRIPDGLSASAAAALPMVVSTAVLTLDLLDLRPGMTLLVHGAGSMVGFAAVQVALRRGVRVIATAGPTFASELATFGAAVTPYGPGMADRVRALAGGDVDLVLDTPRPREGVLPELVALAGGDPKRVVTVSNHEEARRLGARVNLDELIPSGALAHRGFLADYAALAAAGEFRIPIAQEYPLDSWHDAVELLVAGTPHGKLVLVPEADA
jgi:NADPH:quinone reductase-like Zn-dependent oxidoreductase